MNDDERNGRQFRAMLESLEVDQDPGDAVDQRVLARMRRARLHIVDPGATDADQTSMILPTDRGASSAVAHRWTAVKRWTLVAAVTAVAAAGIGWFTAQSRPDPAPLADEGAREPSTMPLDDDAANLADGTVDRLPNNILGMQPLSSTGFRIGSPDVPPGALTSVERVGQAVRAGDSYRIDVRRSLGTELTDHSIVIMPDGSVAVPLGYVDPPSLGGACTGGLLQIGFEVPSTQTIEAMCSQRAATVEADVVVGAVVDVDVDGAVVDLTPITVTLVVDRDTTNERAITLWFGPDDLLWLEPPSTQQGLREEP